MGLGAWGLGLREKIGRLRSYPKPRAPGPKRPTRRRRPAVRWRLPRTPLPLNIFASRHYRIHSDMDISVVRDYAVRLDAMYEEYSKRLADFDVPVGQQFDVFLFAKRSEYDEFTGNRVPNTSGIFIPSLHALAGYEELQGRAGLRQTLQHEAFHQFAWQVIDKDLPIWLDEGLAQVFEEGVWTGRGFILGQVPPFRLDRLRADIDANKLVDFRTFLTMSRDEFQGRMKDAAVGRAEYNQAWAMTQFLIFATDERGQRRYRKRLIGWLRDMHAGKDPMTAYTANFSANFDGFQKRFVEWARTVQPTALAVYSDRVSKVAELLRLFREDGVVFGSIGQLRDHLAKGQFHLTEARDGRTVTLGENALTYLSDLSGKPWPKNELFLDKRRNGPMPDVVLKQPDGAVIRARFYTRGKELDHDLAFE